MEQIVYEIKNEINSYYDEVKGDIDYYCQSEICRMEQSNKDTKDIKAIYLNWIAILETTQNEVMNDFNKFISVEANLVNKTKQDLLQLHLKSIPSFG